MFGQIWECNPLYRCTFVEKPGLFRAVCEDALRLAGQLNIESRMSMFDVNNGFVYTSHIDDEGILFHHHQQQRTNETEDDSHMYLNFILFNIEELKEQLDAIDKPLLYILKDFLESCTYLDKMICEDLLEISSIDNNPGTANNTWTSTSPVGGGTVDTISEKELEEEQTYGGSDEDDDSVSSDIVQWKKDIFMSAFDESDFHIILYHDEDNEWHSANDDTGRVYFFRENSSESSWTLPNEPSNSCKYTIPELPPNLQQMSEEMSAIFNKISNVELSARRQRNAKAYSLIVPNKKDEIENVKWPAHISDGKMHVVCEGPLHYTKISEAGKRVRKNWSSAYVVLTDLFLFIYKDMKAFHSHKSPAEVTLELQGTEVGSGEKVSGRKHVLLLSTPQGLQLALQCDNINSVLHWATTIQHTVRILPKLPITELQNSKLGSIAEGPGNTEDGKKGTSIGRSKSVNFKSKDDSTEDLGGSPAERQVKIKARLKKFFHKRPSMESLVKKGIWKDEPVFGCYLDQACSGVSHSAGAGKVPLFVQKCINLIESSEENMKTDGLYRASGNLSQIQKIRLQIDQNNYTALEREEDVHVLTGALKLFFRELKEPLIPYKQFTKAIKASTTANKKERLSMFVDIVKSLPTANRDTLKFLLQHLLKVTKFQEHNRMHMANVAIVFGPTLMWPEQESQNMALDLMQQNMVIEALLIDYHLIFK